MVLSCHFENEAFVCEAVDLIAQKYGEQAKILIANWWDPMPAEIIDKVFDEVPFPGWAFEHAAVTETSLMMAFAPELVHEERMVDTQERLPVRIISILCLKMRFRLPVYLLRRVLLQLPADS